MTAATVLAMPSPAHFTKPAQRPTVLVTGFEPFGGECINPAWEVARTLNGSCIDGVPIIGEQLPCTFDGAVPTLQKLLRRHKPCLVLALGLAGNRSAISLERVAINWMDARIPDNAGAQPTDLPVKDGGPAAYFTRLPIKSLARLLHVQGLPAEVSASAGSFVCNQVFYGLMAALRRRPAVLAGFIHLPPLPEQGMLHPPSSTLPLTEQVRALQLMIQAMLSGLDETPTVGGSLS